MESRKQGDISLWYSEHKECPNCGVKFSSLHPLANLYPHLAGECLPKKETPLTAEMLLQELAEDWESLRATAEFYEGESRRLNYPPEKIEAHHRAELNLRKCREDLLALIPRIKELIAAQVGAAYRDAARHDPTVKLDESGDRPHAYIVCDCGWDGRGKLPWDENSWKNHIAPASAALEKLLTAEYERGKAEQE